MTDAGSSSGRIAMIELHDAEIGSFSLRPGGALEVDFTHVVVYFEVNPLLYEVRSHKASLQLEGVRRLQLDGTLADDDYVMDDELIRPDGDTGNWVDLLGERCPLGDLVLSFFSGARVSISGQSGLLTLQGEGRLLETWEGPLDDGSGS